MPRQHDKHTLDCCEKGKDQEVHKWSAQTGIYWLSQLCNEEGTHLRTEVHNRLLSNTSQPHKVIGGGTPKALCWILSEEVLPGSKTHGLGAAYPEWYRQYLDRTTDKTLNKNGLPKATSSTASPRRPSYTTPPPRRPFPRGFRPRNPKSSLEDIDCIPSSIDHRFERTDDGPMQSCLRFCFGGVASQ